MKFRGWILAAVLLTAVFCCGSVQAKAAAWTEENGVWYYLEDSGEKHTGWLSLSGKWYYLEPETGAMVTGWQEIDGEWYYFAGSGRMFTGWQEIGGKWYYFRASGKMQTGWLSLSGSWYYLRESGAMQTGWAQIGGAWYFFAGSGRMQTGWMQSSGKWYYFRASGKMETGWLSLSGSWYYMRTSGAMATGWEQISGNWYYFKDSGKMADDEVLTIGEKRYAFAQGGAWRGEQDPMFFAAYDYAQQFLEPGMTKAQKLRACFDGLADCREKNPWIPHYKGIDWPQRYAEYFYENDAGNCFGFAAAFGYMAKAVGYENVYCCNSGGHGWVEIDGLVYDAEWTRHAEGNYFGRSLSATGGPKYATAITRKAGWQYVKI